MGKLKAPNIKDLKENLKNKQLEILKKDIKPLKLIGD